MWAWGGLEGGRFGVASLWFSLGVKVRYVDVWGGHEVDVGGYREDVM